MPIVTYDESKMEETEEGKRYSLELFQPVPGGWTYKNQPTVYATFEEVTEFHRDLLRAKKGRLRRGVNDAPLPPPEDPK